MHPDITKVVKRFNRWHHYVNYKVFKNNKLIKKKNINYVNQVNEFGQVLKKNES